MDVPRYLQCIADGRPAEALAVIRESIPFPAVCGLVCSHPCELKCARTKVDAPVAIRMLKRFAWERGNDNGTQRTKKSRRSGKRIAVIGSGPAGLTAAYYLTRFGHSVTVYEAAAEAGGMMRWGAPDYRLPKEVVRAEVRRIEKEGVVIKTRSRVNAIDTLWADGYHAVFVGIGAQRSVGLRIGGEGDRRIVTGVDFLRSVNQGRRVKLGKRVAVIGAGHCAFDAARTALRGGAQNVTIFYRRSRSEMPAAPEEVEQACAEGVHIHYLATPVKIVRRAGSLRLDLIRNRLGAPDESGRRRPVPIKGSKLSVACDTIITAIGERPVIPRGFNLETGEGNLIRVNPIDLRTTAKGVFAGGDVVTGPGSIIDAIAAGRKAAISINGYLGSKHRPSAVHPVPIGPLPWEEPQVAPRVDAACRDVKERVQDFDQVELGFSEQMAVEEARRCIRCDLRKRDCIVYEPSPWPRSVRNHFSQPSVPHKTTGIAGRGTEEMKTNDVTGRFKRGWVGIGLDFGRPGIGTRFRDVDAVTQALAKIGARFEAENPITKMMDNPENGKLREDVLGEKVLSCVVETQFPIGRLEEALRALKEVTSTLNTVVSVCCINRAEPDGSYPLRRTLKELRIPYYINGKQNAGLGKPLADC
jgi:NADPH-dependent glutamate synthase beta subunit-like oxidoreductase